MKIPGRNITVNVFVDEERSGGRRKGYLERRRDEEILGRRKNNAMITFYDLALINQGTVETPIWAEHPLLFSPNYSVQYGGASSFDPAVRVTMTENFDSAQWLDYYNLFFQIDVADWQHYFRKIDWYDAGLDPTNKHFLTDKGLQRITMMKKPYSANTASYLNLLDASSNDAATISSYKSTYGFAWTPKGLALSTGFRPQMSNALAFISGIFLNEHLPLASQYGKITTEYDPDAPRAEFPAGSGNYIPVFNSPVKFFLLPGLSFWWCYTTDHTNYNGYRYFLGMQWQISPRFYFPNYVEPEWSDGREDSFTGVTNIDPNNRKSDFLTYQKGLANRRCLRVQVTNSYPSGTYTGNNTLVSPSTFPIDYYYGMMAVDGNTPGDSTGMVAPIISASSVSQSERLVGVFQMKGQTYYCWYLPGTTSIVNEGLAGLSDYNTYGFSMWT